MFDFTQIFGAIKEIFSFSNKKLELNNSPEMQSAEKAKKEQLATDEDNRILKERNAEAMRRGLS